MTTDSRPGFPIAIFGPFHPYRGGIAHHTANLAGALAPTHPVLGVNFVRLYPSFLFPGTTQFDSSAEPLRPPGVEVVRCVDSIGPHTWWGAARAIRDFGARLLIVQWWHPFFAPATAAIARGVKRGGVRVLFVCHNVMPHERSIVDSNLARLGLGSADAFLLHNATDLARVEKLYPDRPRVQTPHPPYTFFARPPAAGPRAENAPLPGDAAVPGNAAATPSTTDRDRVRDRLGLRGPTVLFFGLVRPYKGLDVLLRAVALARRAVPLQLVVAGEFYQDRRVYDALVAELGIGDAVQLLDRYVPNEEVEGYFKAADVVVLPYVSATQSGIAQTALVFERPVIVTRVGGLPETVRPGETGSIVPPNDPVALADALVEFFRTNAGERMAPYLKAAAGRSSWVAMIAAVERAGAALGLSSP